MRFAFITDELPRPGLAGHLAMNHAIIGWLRSNGHQVSVLLLRPRLRWVMERYDAAPVIGLGVKTCGSYVAASSLREWPAILARNLLSTLPASVAASLRKRLQSRNYGNADAVLGAFITPGQAAWSTVQIGRLAPDAVIADTIFRAPLFRAPALAHINRVIIAHDLFHLRHQALRSAGYALYPAELTRETEAELLNLADGIAAIQQEEAAVFREMCPDAEICIVPMPALPCARPEKIVRIPGRLVFVGSATLPNLDGLRWLFAEIWPLLRQAYPAVTLDLVGDCGHAFSHLPEGVRRLGRVKNLSPVLHRAALAIAPLRVGSGLKIKILDYARHGLLTVATPESLYGFAADGNAPFIAVGDAQGFAEAVTAALGVSSTAVEKSALDYVAMHYNLNTSFSGLAALLKL